MSPGEVEIEMPFGSHLAQQTGFLHAGAIAAIADSAGRHRAMTLMAEDSQVVTVEFKPQRGTMEPSDSNGERGAVLSRHRISAGILTYRRAHSGEVIVTLLPYTGPDRIQELEVARVRGGRMNSPQHLAAADQGGD